MVFAAIVLMWWDKRIDLAAAGGTRMEAEDTGAMTVATIVETLQNESLPPTSPVKRTIAVKSKWLSLIMLAFVANGLAASSQKVLVELGDGQYAWQFYVMLYAAGAVVVSVVNVFSVGWPNRREAIISGAMAVASVAGNICIVRALDLHVPGTIAYPVANGGSLFLVVLTGFLAFGERVSRFGLAGIVVGIAAVLVLVLN